MSTMLKHAAMTLLSKTLQTFLYKYLLEVDVEGVAMPNLLDGHSGWGVRLCNVQLRDRVVLMKLPGKRRRRKKKEENAKSTKVSSEKEEPKGHHERSWSWNAPKADPNNVEPKKSQVVPEEGKEAVLEDLIAFLKKDSDHKTSMSSDDVMESATPTPPLGCSQHILRSCLSGREYPETPAEDLDVPSAPPSRGIPLMTQCDPLLQHNVVFDTERLNESPVWDEDDDDVADELNGEDEYYWAEQDMVLRLGKGGRIGTLDVRLVGKDLHIMIEDAYLTVEACPNDDTDETTTPDVTTPETTPAEDKLPKRNKPKQNLNVAERILENSFVAKAMSALPHLFLRDCTVRLIVRENSETYGDHVGPEDSVVELGVELFSVTSGDDFMAGFGNEDDSSRRPKKEVETVAQAPQKVSLKRLEEEDENEYILKRIRTGKGPESGISVKIYPPVRRRAPDAKLNEPHTPWAIHSFMNQAKFCFFRCSGLDARARIYLGKKMEIAVRNNNYAWYGEEYDEYTIDSMLFGVDYIAPGPPPPLPPLRRSVSDSQQKNRASGTDLYSTDLNGTQSCNIRSSFHKVARGLIPIVCKKSHLPGDHCPYCWENTLRPNSYSVHPLDSKTPLPGLVFSLSLNDPLEINVDRSSLEVLGNLISLFTKKTDHSKETPLNAAALETRVSDVKNHGEESITHKKWSFRRNITKKESLKDAYPSYMVPENIEVIGIHLAKIVVRMHVMRDDGRDDTYLSFRYWEAFASCITLDVQLMKTKQKEFKDVRFGLGHFSTLEFRGIECKELVSLGLTGDEVISKSDSAKPTDIAKSAWPSIAAVLLHVPSGGEQYESKERHGIQMRYVAVKSISNSIHQERSSVNIRLGVARVDTEYSAIYDMSKIVSQVTQSILGTPVESTPKKENSSGKPAAEKNTSENGGVLVSSLTQYKVHIDGGDVALAPLGQARLPSTKFSGEISSECGFYFETLLKHIELEYGKRASTPKNCEKMLTLSQLASLPESVRLRILLLLKDLTSIEKALAVNKESNSFLRCRAVNKAIVSYGTRPTKAVVTKRKKRIDPKRMSRQEVLNEFMRLDDFALEELWKTYQTSCHKKKL